MEPSSINDPITLTRCFTTSNNVSHSGTCEACAVGDCTCEACAVGDDCTCESIDSDVNRAITSTVPRDNLGNGTRVQYRSIDSPITIRSNISNICFSFGWVSTYSIADLTTLRVCFTLVMCLSLALYLMVTRHTSHVHVSGISVPVCGLFFGGLESYSLRLRFTCSLDIFSFLIICARVRSCASRLHSLVVLLQISHFQSITCAFTESSHPTMYKVLSSSIDCAGFART